MKIPLKNLNHSPYFPHSTNIYICRVTIVLRMYDNVSLTFIFFFFYLVFCETILYALSSLLSTHIQSPEITVLLHISIRICHPILDLCNLCQSGLMGGKRHTCAIQLKTITIARKERPLNLSCSIKVEMI